jgi:virulence-associated protein VagC
MTTTAGHRLILHPMEKCSNAFFSETTNMIKVKLYMNVHHKLTLDPMGKCSNAFFSETTNMIKAKLYMNVH